MKNTSHGIRVQDMVSMDLSRNHLRTLPDAFVHWLGSLKKLDASENELLSVSVRRLHSPARLAQFHGDSERFDASRMRSVP